MENKSGVATLDALLLKRPRLATSTTGYSGSSGEASYSLERPASPTRHLFPSQDVWEDTLANLIYQPNVDAIKLPDNANSTVEHRSKKSFETPEAEEMRKSKQGTYSAQIPGEKYSPCNAVMSPLELSNPEAGGSATAANDRSIVSQTVTYASSARAPISEPIIAIQKEEIEAIDAPVSSAAKLIPLDQFLVLQIANGAFLLHNLPIDFDIHSQILDQYHPRLIHPLDTTVDSLA